MKREYKKATITDLRNRIVDAMRGPAGEERVNTVARALRLLSSNYGVDEANKAIEDFRLTKFGWEQQVGEEPEAPAVNPMDLIDPLDRVEREP